MNIETKNYFGWKYFKNRQKAMNRKESELNFFLNIVIAFFIIIFVSQALVKLESFINISMAGKSLSLLNPFEINVASAATSEAAKMTQSFSGDTIEVLLGGSAKLTVGFKNLTQKNWNSSGAGKVELKLKQASGYKTLGTLSTTPAKPGEIGYFTFSLTAPSKAGIYKNQLYLFYNGTVLSGGTITINVKAVAAKTASTLSSTATKTTTATQSLIVSSSLADSAINILYQKYFGRNASAAEIKNWKTSTAAVLEAYLNTQYKSVCSISYDGSPITPGQTKTSNQLKLVSSSSASTSSSASKVVGLAEICMSINSSSQTTTAQKLLLDECLKIGIKVTDDGATYVTPTSSTSSSTSSNSSSSSSSSNSSTSSSSSASASSSTSSSSSATSSQSTSTTSDSSNGPLIRVGLFYTTSSVVITADSVYYVKDQNGVILATVPANINTTTTFDFSAKTYTISANGVNLTTSSYIRFESNNSSAVFEVVSYNNSPSWNSSLNDNKFLGSLEVRYASATSRLWVINELQLEDYLKGIAETTNYSPIEYQKALITAARSYAYYHYTRGTKHAAENFTVDATNDQVYKGYGSQVRLTLVVAAVEATKGTVVTYNGTPVVTPYFSWSDGYTRNWEDVWGGSAVAWCRAVKEPAGYDKTTMYGHGVGLSARGAILLASDFNYTYDQILKYYFTGIALTKIY